jgi:RNA polymerase sigma factor (sigma-70 family)
MTFPLTRFTLIARLAAGGGEADWREFIQDYWGPVCRFARQRGNLTAEDAEDVAAETLEAIVKNDLLVRWSADRSAKLRTLICAVVRNVLSNRARVQSGRVNLVRNHGGELDRYLDVDAVDPEDSSGAAADAFYAAWAEDLLHQAVDGLFAEFNQSGKGDYFRVLHGRVCEEMTLSEIAMALKLTTSAADSHFRTARERLADRLEGLLRAQVSRYSLVEAAQDEFVVEWARLGDYLRTHGGLESAVRRSCAETES